jgi:release factor glutamine methyltransferase
VNEIELLFSEILNCRRLDLYLNKDAKVNKDKSRLISAALKRRLSGEPIQYILGKTEFMGLEFRVNKNVFIPRPETEILTETALKIAYRLSRIAYRVEILDLGTGSGCIAVSLAKYLDNAKITATDISEKALEAAMDNARLNKASDKITFVNSDLFAEYGIRNTEYDVIVSNPPYIATGEIDELAPEIRCEPRIALNGGLDGLDFYRRIINAAPNYLKASGFLIMEMGFAQREKIKNIFQQSGNFAIREVVKDYSGIDRIIVAQRAEENG